MNSQKEFDSRSYQKAKREGKCVQCRRRTPILGRVHCQHCLGARKELHAERVAAGMCSQCYTMAHDLGFKTCKTCRERSANKARNLKRQIIEAYGGKCECCGESHLHFLNIDHVRNDGAKERREMKAGGRGCGGRIYTKLRKEGYPEGYRVLCWNCNAGRHINGGSCPHWDLDPALALAATGVV